MIGGTQFIQLSPFVPELEGEDMLDVCATHFDPKRYGEPPIERGFFDIGGADVWSGVRENSLLVFGYPTSLRKIQIDDLGALESLKFSLTVTSARYSHPSSAKGLHAIHLQKANIPRMASAGVPYIKSEKTPKDSTVALPG